MSGSDLLEHGRGAGGFRACAFFENRVEPLIEEIGRYLDRRLDNPPLLPTPARAAAPLPPTSTRTGK